MDLFLVEVEDHDLTEVFPFALEDLIKFLRSNIEAEAYSGADWQLRGIYRYDPPGKLVELLLTSTDEGQDADDYLHWAYQLRDTTEQKVVAEFTVHIDGRA
jgi:hypothetical protein